MYEELETPIFLMSSYNRKLKRLHTDGDYL